MFKKEDILKQLKAKKFVSGTKMAQELKLSRTAVWKHISGLKKEGYRIKAIPGRGYRLIKLTEALVPWEIKERLKTKAFGCEIKHFYRVDSTQEIAKRLAEKGFPEGTVVLAEVQKKGKGRLGRDWQSPFGGIWFSVILLPRVNPIDVPKISLLAGLALVESIEKNLSLPAKIKWPNDILIRGKKVAGIITEMKGESDKVEWVILGIGVNANVDLRFLKNFDFPATSLKEELGKKVDRLGIFISLMENLEKHYFAFQEGHFSNFLDSWRRFSETLGKAVRVETLSEVVEGKAIALNGDGALLVELSSGKIRSFTSGDVTHLR